MFTPLRHRVRRDGAVVYRLADGGTVWDEAERVRVAEPSARAAFLALSLAQERFGGRALVVEGSAAFKAQLTELAALPGMTVRFADAGLDASRRHREAVPSGHGRAEPDPGSAQRRRGVRC